MGADRLGAPGKATAIGAGGPDQGSMNMDGLKAQASDDEGSDAEESDIEGEDGPHQNKKTKGNNKKQQTKQKKQTANAPMKLLAALLGLLLIAMGLYHLLHRKDSDDEG